METRDGEVGLICGLTDLLPIDTVFRNTTTDAERPGAFKHGALWFRWASRGLTAETY